MIQPYFDPTNYFQGGSVFSQYLQGFVKERSAMNKQMMEIALAQSDPSFLQDQIQIMNKNIIELEKAKAKALQGDAKYNKQLMSLVTQQMNKESQGILEVGREQVKRGGAASIALTTATGQVATVLGDSSLNRQEKEAALTGLFGKTSDPDMLDALSIVIKERAGDANIRIANAIPPTQRDVEKASFVSQGSADRVQMPDARTQTKKALKIMEEIGGGGQVSAKDQAALAAQFDQAIAKYEAQRAGYETQLQQLQEGGVDPFSGFSRNYMLDNPFIQMSRSQGKVDALASAIEAAQQEDFRTPFARVEREAATPRDILSGNVYDEDDEFFGGTFGEYYQKRMSSDFGVPMTPDPRFDADELAIMNRQGMRESTTERKPEMVTEGTTFQPLRIFADPNLTEGGTSAAEQRLQQIEQLDMKPAVIEETITANPDASFPSDPSKEGQFLQLETRKIGPAFATKTPTTTFAALEIRNPEAASDFYKMVGGSRNFFDVNQSKFAQQQNRTSALKKQQKGEVLDPYERFLTEQSAEDLNAVIDDVYSMSRRNLIEFDKKYPTTAQRENIR